MIRISVSEMTTYRWSLEEDVAGYQEAGLMALGVWRRKLSDYGEADAVQLVRHSPLAVSSLSWAGGFTGSDGRSHPESVRDGYDALHLANTLRASCLITHTGARGGHTSNHARRLVCQAIGSLLPVAEEHNMVLALEPMHEACGGQWTFLTSIDQTLDLIRELASPHVKMVFDTYHMGHDKRNVERLPDLIPDLALLQLADAKGPPDQEQNRCCLGEGTIAVERIVQTLLDAGYEKYCEVELLGEDIEWMAYPQMLDRCQHWASRVRDAQADAPHLPVQRSQPVQRSEQGRPRS